MIDQHFRQMSYVHTQKHPAFTIATWASLIRIDLHESHLSLMRAYPGSFHNDRKNSPEYMFTWLSTHINQINNGWVDVVFLEQLKPFFLDLTAKNILERKRAYRNFYLAAIAKDKES